MTIYVKDEVFIGHDNQPFQVLLDPNAAILNGGGQLRAARTADMLLTAIKQHRPVPQIAQVLSYDEVVQKNRVLGVLERGPEDGYYLLDTTDAYDVILKLIKWVVPTMSESWQRQAEGLVALIEKAPSERPIAALNHENP